MLRRRAPHAFDDSRGFHRRCWSFSVVARILLFRPFLPFLKRCKPHLIARSFFTAYHCTTFISAFGAPPRKFRAIAQSPCPGSLSAAGALDRTLARRC